MSLGIAIISEDMDFILMSGDTRGCYKDGDTFYIENDNLTKITEIDGTVFFGCGTQRFIHSVYEKLESKKPITPDKIKSVMKRQWKVEKQYEKPLAEGIFSASYEYGLPALRTYQNDKDFEPELDTTTLGAIVYKTYGCYANEALSYIRKYFNNTRSAYWKSNKPPEFYVNALVKMLTRLYNSLSDEQMGGYLTVYKINRNGPVETLVDRKKIKDKPRLRYSYENCDNIFMSGVQLTSDLIGTGFEKILLPKDQRTKAIMWKNNKELVRKVNESWAAKKDSLTHESRYDITSLKALGFDKRIFQSDILQALNDITMKGLNLGDIPFVEAAYKNSLGQFMKARGLTEVTAEAEAYATRRALEATFKETNEMASIINRLKQKSVIGTLVEGAIPFSKTPANITMRAIDYSPGGLLKALYDTKTGKGATKAIEDLSKGLTGTALLALGMWLSKIGWIKVERNRSEKAEGLLQKAGEQPYSIITPKGSYTFDWAQPFAVPLAMGVAVQESLSKRQDGDSLINALQQGLYAGGDTIFNMTMLQNIKKIFSGGSPTEKIAWIPVSYVEQAIPSIFGQAARTIDPVRRSTYDPDPVKKEWNRVKSRIPFVSKSLEPYLNIWGEEQEQGGILEQFISPGYFATPTDDHVTLEVARLYDAFKDTDMLPKVAPAKFSSDKVEYVLSAEQRTQFQRDMGQANYSDLARLISSAEYQRLTDAQKVKRIKGIINDNYNDMKDAIIKEYKLIQDSAFKQ